MANKRDLKRTINYITSELFAETMAAIIYSDKVDKEAGDNLLASIIITRDDFIKRVSHPEPGMKAHKYFKALATDFNNSMSEIIDRISNLG
jgi:hypothetical protein